MSETGHKFVATPRDVRLYHQAYRQLGGQSNIVDFGRHLQVFFDRTFDSFIGGYGMTRKDAMTDFAAYLNHHTTVLDTVREANLYLQAVDSVDPYT